MDGERPRGDRPPSGAGEHTSEILAELGYTEEEVHGFLERGVAIGSSPSPAEAQGGEEVRFANAWTRLRERDQ